MHSVETLLARRGSLHDWSVVWSTTQIPGMDTAHGGTHNRMAGRRQLRFTSMLLASSLAVHCRVVSAVLSGGGFTFILMLLASVALLANPLRHFELFLGQWSMSGPGRAFRFIPLFDGIGLAIAVTCMIRAVMLVCLGAMSFMYVTSAISDDDLPFTYCRDFDLNKYEPTKRVRSLPDKVGQRRYLVDAVTAATAATATTENTLTVPPDLRSDVVFQLTRKLEHEMCYCVNNTSGKLYNQPDSLNDLGRLLRMRREYFECKEDFSLDYPLVPSTPAYNYFYVEVMRLRPDLRYRGWNMTLLPYVGAGWLLIWALMLREKIFYKKLVWNNAYAWLAAVPLLWVVALLAVSIGNVSFEQKREFLRDFFDMNYEQTFVTLSDALETALYIHAAAAGTEIIMGKGLNHYAQGHIDPQLNSDNLVHSVVSCALVSAHAMAAVCCAAAESSQPPAALYIMHQLGGSTLWVLPMYSKCIALGSHTHFFTAVIFGGLSLSYFTVSYIFIKTTLHCIFEYKVKLVFNEQKIVFVLVLVCMSCSLLFVTPGGLVALEAVDLVTSGLVVPLICLLELVALLYVYRGGDFVSDMLLATEENTCSTRINTMWKIIPFLVVLTLGVKIAVVAVWARVPTVYLLYALCSLLLAVLALLTRAVYNVIRFLHSTTLRNTRTRTRA